MDISFSLHVKFIRLLKNKYHLISVLYADDVNLPRVSYVACEDAIEKVRKTYLKKICHKIVMSYYVLAHTKELEPRVCLVFMFV